MMLTSRLKRIDCISSKKRCGNVGEQGGKDHRTTNTEQRQKQRLQVAAKLVRGSQRGDAHVSLYAQGVSQLSKKQAFSFGIESIPAWGGGEGAHNEGNTRISISHKSRWGEPGVEGAILVDDMLCHPG
jgi:hypothetical protein